MIVVACPGQGSQKPGFLAPWIEREDRRERLRALGEAAGVDLVLHGTESDADTIRDTAIAQPLIVAAAILAWDALREEQPELAERVGAVAGHSVGEITAAYVAGILDAETAMRFVGLRSRLMAEDAAATPTGMAAVVGGDEATVLERLEELGLSPANFNGGGQIVAAGEPAGLEALAADGPRGSRVVPLQVAGAFHTSFMASACERLGAERARFTASDPALTIWSNEDGASVASGEAFVDAMVRQVAQPVRWDRCMASIAESGAEGLLELAPAGTLVGLAKRGLKGLPAAPLNAPADLEGLGAKLAPAS